LRDPGKWKVEVTAHGAAEGAEGENTGKMGDSRSLTQFLGVPPNSRGWSRDYPRADGRGKNKEIRIGDLENHILSGARGLCKKALEVLMFIAYPWGLEKESS